MEEQASFEMRAVLAPRRVRRARIALLVPVVALVATAWAGLSGARSDQQLPTTPDAVAAAPSIDPVAASPSASPLPRPPEFPTEALGLEVRSLVDVRAQDDGRKGVIAVAGWYLPTAITGCPPQAYPYIQDSLAELPHRVDVDSLAFCDRFGVLYASRPELVEGLPSSHLEDNRSKKAGLPAFAVMLVMGIRVPPALETIGGGVTPVVVVVHFVKPGKACVDLAGCTRELVVDYLAWVGDSS